MALSVSSPSDRSTVRSRSSFDAGWPPVSLLGKPLDVEVPAWLGLDLVAGRTWCLGGGRFLLRSASGFDWFFNFGLSLSSEEPEDGRGLGRGVRLLGVRAGAVS